MFTMAIVICIQALQDFLTDHARKIHINSTDSNDYSISCSYHMDYFRSVLFKKESPPLYPIIIKTQCISHQVLWLAHSVICWPNKISLNSFGVSVMLRSSFSDSLSVPSCLLKKQATYCFEQSWPQLTVTCINVYLKVQFKIRMDQDKALTA